jgi:hypothetical protein
MSLITRHKSVLPLRALAWQRKIKTLLKVQLSYSCDGVTTPPTCQHRTAEEHLTACICPYNVQGGTVRALGCWLYKVSCTINALSILPAFPLCSPEFWPRLCLCASLPLPSYLPPLAYPHSALSSPQSQDTRLHPWQCLLGLLFTLLTPAPQTFPGDSFVIPQCLATVVF